MKNRWWIVIPILILIAAGANVYRCYGDDMRARENAARVAALRDELTQMRKAIQNFRAEQGEYPRSLEELIPKYLRRVPADPLTNAADWRLITEERVEAGSDFTTGGAAQAHSVIIDVRSSAPGKDAGGRHYSDY